MHKQTNGQERANQMLLSRCSSPTWLLRQRCSTLLHWEILPYINMAGFGEAQPGDLFIYREDEVTVLPISITFLALMSLTKFAISWAWSQDTIILPQGWSAVSWRGEIIQWNNNNTKNNNKSQSFQNYVLRQKNPRKNRDALTFLILDGFVLHVWDRNLFWV